MTTAPAPYIFLGYQQAWAADYSPVKVTEKSRRVGLTWAEAGDATLTAASENGMDIWYIGYNKDMAEEFISACADWVKKYAFAATEVEEEIVEDEDKDILTFKIKFASGKRITALSSRPSNLRGKQGLIIIDEAAFHDDLKGLLKAALAFLMWGGKVHVISTHDGEENAFNDLVKDIRTGRKPYSLHRITFKDAVAQGLYQRICLVTGQTWSAEAEAQWVADIRDSYGDDADEELDCIPAQGSGTFLSRALIEKRMSADIPVIRYEQNDAFKFEEEHIRTSVVQAWCEDHLLPLLDKLDPDRLSVLGEDFGRTGDLTVLQPLQETQEANWRAPFTLELRNMPFEQQKQIVFYILDRLPNFSCGAFDARGNGQYLAEVAAQKYGEERIFEVMLSEKFYRENMPRYKAAFEDASIILPKDADIIADHRAFKIIKGVARLPEGKTKGQDKKQRHGDAGIAGAMAWFCTYQEVDVYIDFDVVTAGHGQAANIMKGWR